MSTDDEKGWEEELATCDALPCSRCRVGIGFLPTNAKAASKAMRSWQAAHSQGPTRLADLYLGVLEVQLSLPMAHPSLCSVQASTPSQRTGDGLQQLEKGRCAAADPLARPSL
jgi:hypothetical protein